MDGYSIEQQSNIHAAFVRAYPNAKPSEAETIAVSITTKDRRPAEDMGTASNDGGIDSIARISASAEIDIDESVPMLIGINQLHLFDAKTGGRIPILDRAADVEGQMVSRRIDPR